MRSLARHVAVAAIALALAACAQDRDDASVSLEAVAPSSVVAETPWHKRPLATLPASLGRIRAIRVRDFADGLRQEILLDGGAARLPRGTLVVSARSSRRATLDEAVSLSKPTEAAIRAEIVAAFPHVSMRIVERPSQNAYGPYGLAIGRAAGDVRCAFVWQWIEADRLPADAEVSGPLSIRASLCRTGTTFDAMAAALDGLTVTRRSDSLPDLPQAGVLPAAPRKRPEQHWMSSIRRNPSTVDAMSSIDTQTIDAQRPHGSPFDLASDLPPEALSGPKPTKKQD